MGGSSSGKGGGGGGKGGGGSSFSLVPSRPGGQESDRSAGPSRQMSPYEGNPMPFTKQPVTYFNPNMPERSPQIDPGGIRKDASPGIAPAVLPFTADLSISRKDMPGRPLRGGEIPMRPGARGARPEMYRGPVRNGSLLSDDDGDDSSLGGSSSPTAADLNSFSF